MAKPTDEAATFYNLAAQWASLAEQATLGTTNYHGSSLAKAIHQLAKGLAQTNTGLRATYMLLEEIKKQNNLRGSF